MAWSAPSLLTSACGSPAASPHDVRGARHSCHGVHRHAQGHLRCLRNACHEVLCCSLHSAPVAVQAVRQQHSSSCATGQLPGGYVLKVEGLEGVL
jgi:hypothetical protein